MCSTKDKKKPPEKIWVDEGKEFKGDFAWFCAKKDIVVYNTHSEMKFCFAERYIKTLKSILFIFLHENNTSRYIDHHQSFVSLIKSRPNRTTKATKSNTLKKFLKLQQIQH